MCIAQLIPSCIARKTIAPGVQGDWDDGKGSTTVARMGAGTLRLHQYSFRRVTGLPGKGRRASLQMSLEMTVRETAAMVVVAGMSKVVKRLSKFLCSRLRPRPMSLPLAMTMSVQSLATYLAKY